MAATLKQKTAFKKVLDNMANQNPQTAGQLLVDSGYDITTARHPIQVFNSQGFQELLAGINDKVILDKFYAILQDEDKRSSLAAGIELLKLKDRYPSPKTNAIGLFGNFFGQNNESKNN